MTWELITQYIHRTELPCDEDATSVHKSKVHWVAYGQNIAGILDLDEDALKQHVDPCVVRELINDSDILDGVPSDQEDHYHRIVFRDLMNKLDKLPSETPPGDWFFNCMWGELV